MATLQKLYETRFQQTGVEKRKRVWEVLCRSFFQPLIGPTQDILDVACGYGEFINQIEARNKAAIDMNPDAARYLNPGIALRQVPADDMRGIGEQSFDIVFTSNFLEHLPNKSVLDAVFGEVRRVLRPGGRFIILGPNIRYAYKQYWDYYDHYLPLSHLSLAEGLGAAGFEVARVIPRFLPYTMNSATPTPASLVRLYVALPFAWRVFGKQFLVVARKPAAA